MVLEIKVRNIFTEGTVANLNTYECELLDILKGDSVTLDEGIIIISVLKGSVEVGETYVVLVNTLGEFSLIYAQSSKKSVIPVYDEETINEIIRLISLE